MCTKAAVKERGNIFRHVMVSNNPNVSKSILMRTRKTQTATNLDTIIISFSSFVFEMKIKGSDNK